MDEPASPEWIEDCMRWRGKVLTGAFAHWCLDWDMLPVDETTEEFSSCTCYHPIQTQETSTCSSF